MFFFAMGGRVPLQALGLVINSGIMRSPKAERLKTLATGLRKRMGMKKEGCHKTC